MCLCRCLGSGSLLLRDTCVVRSGTAPWKSHKSWLFPSVVLWHSYSSCSYPLDHVCLEAASPGRSCRAERSLEVSLPQAAVMGKSEIHLPLKNVQRSMVTAPGSSSLHRRSRVLSRATSRSSCIPPSIPPSLPPSQHRPPCKASPLLTDTCFILRVILLPVLL